MKTVNINNQFYNNIHIGTKAERLAMTSNPPYLYDKFIETDTNLNYLWTGTKWDPPIEESRYGGVAPYTGQPMPVDISLGGGAGLPFLKFLTAAGDGTGVNNLVGDYSSSPSDFLYTAPSNGMFFCKFLTIQIAHPGDFLQGYYGGIPLSGGLPIGVTFFAKVGAVYIPLLGGFHFKTNNDWFGLTSHFNLHTFAAASNALIIDFRIIEDFGSPLILDSNQSLVVRLNDNFQGLTLHRFSLKGTLVTKV